MWVEDAMAKIGQSPTICLEGLRSTTKNLRHDDWSPGRDLNRGLALYEAAVPPTWSQRSTVSFLMH